jgi:hypothetical protein
VFFKLRVLFKVIVNSLNIRSMPTTSGSNIVGTLELSEEVIGDEVQESNSGSWIKIEGTTNWFQSEDDKGNRLAEIVEILDIGDRPKSTPRVVQREEPSQV